MKASKPNLDLLTMRPAPTQKCSGVNPLVTPMAMASSGQHQVSRASDVPVNVVAASVVLAPNVPICVSQHK